MSTELTHYPNQTVESLEFDKIILLLKSYCLDELGKRTTDQETFSCSDLTISYRLDKTWEFKNILTHYKFPAHNYYPLDEELKYMQVSGYILPSESIKRIYDQIKTVESIKEFFLKKHPDEFPVYQNIIKDVVYDKKIAKKIEDTLDEKGYVKSNASNLLDNIRINIQKKNKVTDVQFNKTLKKHRQNKFLADAQESIRNNRRVLAVLSENKRKVKGIIHDQSDTGKITYIEPDEVIYLNNEITELQIDEKREIQRILKELTSYLNQFYTLFENYQQLLADIDFTRAKGVLALKMDAMKPIISEHPGFDLKEAFHPYLFLLNKEARKETIPLSLKLDKNHRMLIISGPNAGGKTVALKTVGLIQLMCQFGLLIPCDENSKIGIFEQVFTDLGDSQSLEDELSTYSSRLKKMNYFLKHANAQTLILIDEFGTGTDPVLGGAMAESMLEQLSPKKIFGIITTHYSNLKKMAERNPTMLNASMLFDQESLSPTFQLQVGKPGSSYTFEIAKRSGLPQTVIQKARTIAKDNEVQLDDLINQLELERTNLKKEKKKLAEQDAQVKSLVKKFNALSGQLSDQRKKLQQTQLNIEADGQKILEQKVHASLKEINKNKSKENLEKQLNDLKKQKKEFVEERRKKISGNQNLKTLYKKGTTVYVPSIDTYGELLDVKGKNAMISLNGTRTTLPIDRIEIKQKPEEHKKGNIPKKKTLYSDVETEFDIRGLTAREAKGLLEEYIDQSLLNDTQEIKIIHGKGSGKLRNTVKQVLQEYNRFIASANYEHEKHGGDGATIIQFK